MTNTENLTVTLTPATGNAITKNVALGVKTLSLKDIVGIGDAVEYTITIVSNAKTTAAAYANSDPVAGGTWKSPAAEGTP